MIQLLRGPLLTDFGIVAVHDPIDNFSAGKRVRSLHEGERSQSPVDPVHPQVFREVVRQILSFLLGNALNQLEMSSLRDEPGRETECRPHGDRPRVSATFPDEYEGKEARFVLSFVPNFAHLTKFTESRWIKRKNSSKSRPSSSKREPK